MVRFWPGPVIGDIENCPNPMAAYCLKADLDGGQLRNKQHSDSQTIRVLLLNK
jgi:hypothetical protein